MYPTANNNEDSLAAPHTKQDLVKEETYYPLAEGEVEDAPGNTLLCNIRSDQEISLN